MNAPPAAWVWAALGDVVDVLDHLRVPVNRVERAERLGTIPYYGATGQVGWIDKPLFSEELCLLGEDGAPFFDLAKSKAYVIDGPSWVNNHAHVLRARGRVTTRFLKYALDQVDYRPFVTGTTRAKLTKSAMSRIPVPIPPLAEQRRIVARIEEHLSRLEAANSQLAHAGERLARMKLLILKALFQGLEETVALKEVADVRLGRQRSPKNHFGPTMRPYLRAANVTWDGLNLEDVKEMNFTPQEAATYELRSGDVLLAEASGSASEVGKPVIWHGEIAGCCFQNTLIRVRSRGPRPDYLRLVFLRAALLGQFAEASPGVGIRHLGSSRLAEWPVPVSSDDRQAEIVAAAERHFSLVDAMSGHVAKARRQAESLRRSILVTAFRGELVPHDPNDEAASVLLERIAAERIAVPRSVRKRRETAKA